jgi:endo-1,4-beta-xylanase
VSTLQAKFDTGGSFSKLLRLVSLAVLITAIVGIARGEDTPQWLADANNRIEKFRKADLTVIVVDSAGKAVPDAQVHVQMKRHAFGFGTAVTAAWLTTDSPAAEKYRQMLLNNFNQIVFENDLKWPWWTTESWGNGGNHEQTMKALDWLDAHHMPARGHYLAWATWSGPEAYGGSEDVATLPKRLFDEMTAVAGDIGNRVMEWDVINHPVGWSHDTYENRIGLDFYSKIIKHAREVTPPGMPLWINEDEVVAGTARADDYERIIDYLIANGTPPDGIGFQSHFIEEWGNRIENTPVEEIYGRIDRFAHKGLRLRVTEFDIDTRKDKDPDPNKSDFEPDNPELQGKLLHDYLTAEFSHPAIEAITFWGFWGGAHYRGDAGALFNTDWSERPSGKAYRDLVFNKWWTDVNGTTNKQGNYDVRGFKGLYDITVSHNGEEKVLSDVELKDNKSVEISLP